MAVEVKFLTGSKAEIDNQIDMGAIDAGDIVLTSDSDELIFINPSIEKKIIKSKTQQSYVLNGTDLGGLKDGDIVAEGVDIDALLKLITTKAIPVTYEKPEIEIEGSVIEREVGSLITAEIKSHFTQNDAGSLTKHNILQDKTVIYEGGLAPSIQDVFNFTATDDVIVFESQAHYQMGDIKNNNLGEEIFEGAISAGTITSNPIIFKGYRNLFYGSGVGEIFELDSDNIRMLDVLANPTDGMDFSISMLPGDQYVLFAYPSYLNDVEQITHVQMMDEEIVSDFTQAFVEVEGNNRYEPITYKVYIYKTDAPVASKVTFDIKIGG